MTAPRSYIQRACTAPFAPVVESVDTPALHAGDSLGRPGPNPGRGTFTYSMGTMTKKLKKPKKRGPKEERLVITEDPQAALTRLLKAPPPKRGK